MFALGGYPKQGNAFKKLFIQLKPLRRPLFASSPKRGEKCR
jgi:hypothetical protein